MNGYRSAALWWLVILAVAAGLLTTAPTASAHASVVASSPSDGSRLETSPTVLCFELNEPVSLVDGSAQLIDVDGARYPFAATVLEAARQRIVVTLSEPVPDGSYLATARVVSADTHVVSLSIRFTVGAADAGQWAEAGGVSAAVNPLVVYSVKIAVYAGLVLSAGLFLAARWAWPKHIGSQRFQIVYRVGSALLAVGLVGRLAVLVTEQAGGLLNASFSAVWAIVTTPFGIALVAALALSLLAIAYPPSNRVVALGIGGVQAAVAITAVTLGGHGGSTELWPLPFVVTFVHVYAVAVWLGGLGMLLLVLTSVQDVTRWHRVALAHVGLVILAGATLALLQVRPFAALVTTSYGVTLAVKLVLVAGAVASAYVVWRRYSRGQTRTRVVAVEAVLVALVIVATSLLSSLTPAKDSYTTTVATQLDFGGDDVLNVDIDTVRRGAQVLSVEQRRVRPGSSVSVEMSSAQANVARLPVDFSVAQADGAVVWTSEGLIVPSPGQWKVTVRFDDGDGSPRLASFSYEVL